MEPEVTDFIRLLPRKNLTVIDIFSPVEFEFPRLLITVEEADCSFSAAEFLNPGLVVADLHIPDALPAESVLIDSDHFLVGEYGKSLLVHLSEVISGNKRCRHHTPHRELSAVFIHSEDSVAHLKHIRVIPVSRSGILGKAGVLVDNSADSRCAQ